MLTVQAQLHNLLQEARGGSAPRPPTRPGAAGKPLSDMAAKKNYVYTHRCPPSSPTTLCYGMVNGSGATSYPSPYTLFPITQPVVTVSAAA
jgi:hypothetical protein